MNRALAVEWRKFRRSAVTRTATVLMVAFLPAMGLGFYSVAQQGGTGAVALKAQAMAIGEGWDGYLGLVDQIGAVAVFIGAGIVSAWVFGREHADRTFPSLFALPVSRVAIATAKLVVLAGWVILLAGLLTAVSLLLGAAADVGVAGWPVVGRGAARLFAIVSSTGALSLGAGLAASMGRGYLPAVGAIILVVMTAQVAVLFGTGGWFPFAVPGLMAISGTEGAPVLSAVQIGLVPLTATVAAWLTVDWWRRAEVV
jgi:ABC-2 type transport system permease protein